MLWQAVECRRMRKFHFPILTIFLANEAINLFTDFNILQLMVKPYVLKMLLLTFQYHPRHSVFNIGIRKMVAVSTTDDDRLSFTKNKRFYRLFVVHRTFHQFGDKLWAHWNLFANSFEHILRNVQHWMAKNTNGVFIYRFIKIRNFFICEQREKIN